MPRQAQPSIEVTQAVEAVAMQLLLNARAARNYRTVDPNQW
jgi:hypothetical protein